MTYNLTNLTNTYDITYVAGFVNEQSGGVMAFTILISLFLLIFIATKGYESKRSFAAATFATTIISVLMTGVGWISIYVSVGLILLSAASAFMLNSENG